MKTLLTFVLGCVVMFLLGFATQQKLTTYEYQLLVDISLEKDQARISELGKQGWQLVFVTPEARRNSATLYFQRTK